MVASPSSCLAEKERLRYRPSRFSQPHGSGAIDDKRMYMYLSICTAKRSDSSLADNNAGLAWVLVSFASTVQTTCCVDTAGHLLAGLAYKAELCDMGPRRSASVVHNGVGVIEAECRSKHCEAAWGLGRTEGR